MRQEKIVKIDDREFIIRELKVKQVIKMLEKTALNANDSDDKPDGVNFFKDELQRVIDLSMDGEHKVEDFYEYAPSELKQLYDGFKEVNTVFFDIAQKTGIDSLLSRVISELKKDFIELAVNSSKRDIQTSSNTDTPISLKH